MKKIISLLFLVSLLPIANEVQAQDQIRCESDGNRYRLCRARIYRGDQVHLSQRFSKASCQRGRSWGIERGGIWVDRGCRADFIVTSSRGSDSYDNRYRDDRYSDNRYRDDRFDRGGYDNRYSGRYGNRRRDYREGYDRRYDDRDYNYRSNREHRRERRRIAEEKRKIAAERRQLERQRKSQTAKRGCPSGARVGRCSDRERARGCKDWKAADRTPCKSGG